jgi:hypothetical protein
MEEEGVPSTTLREVSLLKMLSESNHIVKCDHMLLGMPRVVKHAFGCWGWGMQVLATSLAGSNTAMLLPLSANVLLLP